MDLKNQEYQVISSETSSETPSSGLNIQEKAERLIGYGKTISKILHFFGVKSEIYQSDSYGCELKHLLMSIFSGSL